jgi:hypothetical protein
MRRITASSRTSQRLQSAAELVIYAELYIVFCKHTPFTLSSETACYSIVRDSLPEAAGPHPLIVRLCM